MTPVITTHMPFYLRLCADATVRQGTVRPKISVRDEEAVGSNPPPRPLVRRVWVSRLGVGCRWRGLCPGFGTAGTPSAPRSSLVSVSHYTDQRPFEPVPLHPVRHKVGGTPRTVSQDHLYVITGTDHPWGWGGSRRPTGIPTPLLTGGMCICVNGNRKLTSWRQVKIDHLRGLGFVGRGGGDAAEVSVFEAVAVSFEGDDFGVVDQSVDHGGGDVVAEDFAPATEGFVAGDD
jgi:hypothetical protein